MRIGSKAREEAREKGGRAVEWAEEQAGGPARLQVILLLAAVLGLDTADKAAVSTVAGGLKQSFQLSNLEIGYLISVVSIAGAVTTLPIGILVDRMHRKRLLAAAVSLWTLAMAVSGTASSFLYLLLTRLFLGAVTATALPVVASLTGDFFPARERARVYGMILAGELVGTGLGFLIAGEVSSLFGWRSAFYALAVPSGVLAWMVWRYLPEPARGGQGWLQPGQKEIHPEQEAENHTPAEGQQKEGKRTELARKMVRRKRTEPREDLVLHEDPVHRNIWWAFRYVLRIRTNVLLIIASALGYYFFSGLRAFAMIYFTQHYALARSTVSSLTMLLGIGALAGVVGSGRLADHLLRRGLISARILVPGVALFFSALFFAPAIWSTDLALALPFMILGAGALAAANPPLDAARLDIMHPRLWGRAEAVRVTLRMFLEGAAPMIFGFFSIHLFGGGPAGLKWTFLFMLLALIAASSLAIPARRTYPPDVATAGASVEATSGRK